MVCSPWYCRVVKTWFCHGCLYHGSVVSVCACGPVYSMLQKNHGCTTVRPRLGYHGWIYKIRAHWHTRPQLCHGAKIIVKPRRCRGRTTIMNHVIVPWFLILNRAAPSYTATIESLYFEIRKVSYGLSSRYIQLLFLYNPETGVKIHRGLAKVYY